MLRRSAKLTVAVLTGLLAPFLLMSGAGAQVVDADPDVETVIVEEGIRDSSSEVQAVVTALFGVSIVSLGLTLAYAVHTSPRRRARYGAPRRAPAHRKAREMPLGLDELVPGAPPVTDRSPVPVPTGTAMTNVEPTHG